MVTSKIIIFYKRDKIDLVVEVTQSLYDLEKTSNDC